MTKVEKIVLIVLLISLSLTFIFWKDVRAFLGNKDITISEENIEKDKKGNDSKKEKDKKDKDKTSSGINVDDTFEAAYAYHPISCQISVS